MAFVLFSWDKARYGLVTVSYGCKYPDYVSRQSLNVDRGTENKEFRLGRRDIEA